MTSRFLDDNNETEEETLHKKRARRVSFAETTAVHFFNRDEECESTPDAEKEDNGKLRRSDSDEIMELLQSSSSDDDSDGGDGDDVDAVLKSSFLRPLESPSSGSCFGSATSNDEDNFFGPVSAEFIRPRRLSDSALSDDNHEVTMDSTAFSMNFRSLARSDSGGEFKTPTGVRVPFGERTADPTSTASSHGDSMVLTGTRMRVSHSSLPVGNVNDSGNSDDMSIVGESHSRYDYGKLPPELDVLLAEGCKDVETASLAGDIECSNSAIAMNTENGQAISGLKILDLIDNKDDVSLHTSVLPQISEKDKEGRIGSEVSGMFESPPSATQSQELPIAGSISSLLPKRRKIFKESAALPYAQLNSAEGDHEFRVKGTINRSWSTSVFAKSVSRLKRLEVSFLSASKVEGNASRSRVPGFSLRSMENNDQFDYGSKSSSFTRVDAPVACLDVRFAESEGKGRRASESDNHSLRNTRTLKHASYLEVEKDEKFTGLHKSSPCPKNSAECVMISSSTASIETGLVNSKSNDLLESELESLAIKTPPSMKSNSSLNDTTFNDLRDSSNAGMPGDFACSPGNGMVNKVSASPLYEGIPFMLNMGDQAQKEVDDLAFTVNKYSSFLVEKKDKSKLSSCGINHVEDVLQERPMLINKFINPVKSACTEIILKDNVSKTLNVISSNDDVETGRTLSSSTRGLTVQRTQSSPGSTRSSDGRPNDSTFQVFTSFRGVTKQLLTPLSVKFNLAQIAKLDDILDDLHKLKSYELLHHEKALDSASFLNSKRVANTKLLLYKTVCQKAKLQLMRLKRDRLSDQACRIKSRVDESEKLMSNCHHISEQSEGDKITCVRLDGHSTDSDNRSLVSAKMSSLRKEFEDTDCEIRKLNKSFYSHIKDMKELTSIETAASVKGLLKKMVACQSMQSKLQLSKIESLHAMHGQPNILLDHGGFMLQSFSTKCTATPGLLLTNRLNNEKIAKMFINDMDVHTAFSFVLSGDTHHKYESLKTIAEQTQKTVSLLHTLLDVIEEIQLAMIELRSLTWSKFCQPSAGKLDLQLSITDFKSGARVTLNIDITCLNRGVYPSHVLPYDVQVLTARNHVNSKSLVADIRTAVRGVTCGFMRIINICHCVSRLVQAGGMS